MIQLLLGQIPEAIYFALFMIFTKQLKEKRLLYIILMILEYIMILTIFRFSIWIQILYTFLSYIILKLLYNDKAQVTDIFTFTIASVVLIFISAFSYTIISAIFNIKLLAYILKDLLMIIFLVCAKNKLYKIQKLYKTLWNRNDKLNKKIKTTTFRSINVILFNIVFWIINFGMIYAITFYERS
jgi:hypothetical protein